MIIRGTGLLRNLHGHERIHEDNPHNNVAHEPHEGGKAHILSVNGQDYIMRKHGGPLSGDPFFQGIHGHTIDVDGEFIGPILFVNSFNVVS